MTDEPNARELLLAAGEALKPAREIRYLKTLGDLTPEELEIGARNLRALAYSCTTGAVRLEAALRALAEAET